MSDSSAGRTHNTVAIKAALVFPGDPVPNMGHDVARIPVRVVWREGDAPADRTAGGGLAGPVSRRNANAMPGDDLGGDDPAPGVAAASGPEQPPSPDLSGGGPIAKFLEVNEALDRISGDADAGMLGVGVAVAANNANAAPATSPILLAAASNPEEEAASISEGGSLNHSGVGAIGGPLSGSGDVKQPAQGLGGGSSRGFEGPKASCV